MVLFRDTLSLESRLAAIEPPLICSHCHLVDYKGYWFSSNFHFSLAFYGKYTLAVGFAVFLTERILVCSATPHFSAHSSFMILMRVFFQETHISLFDLGASVRIFF